MDIIVEEKFIPDVDRFENEDNNDILSTVDHVDDEDNKPGHDSVTKSLILTGDGQYLYKCKCNKRYQHWGKYKKHEKNCQNNQNVNLIICRNWEFGCSKTFTSTVDYERHLNSCADQKSKNDNDGLLGFPCDIMDCSSEFKSERDLSSHKKIVHVPRRFACLYCDHTFKTKSAKINHERNIHFKTKSSKYPGKITKKLKKSQGIARVKVMPESKFEKIEIKQEFMEENVGRITRSRNKKTSFASFFDLKNDPGSAKKTSDSDGDTSTTASFEDSDSEDLEKPKNSKKFSKKYKLKPKNQKKISKIAKFKQIKLEESDEYLCSVCYESFSSKIDVKNHEKNCNNVIKKGPRGKRALKDPNYKTIGTVKEPLLDNEIHCEYEDCDYICPNTKVYNQHIDYIYIHNRKIYESSKSENRICFLCKKHFNSKIKQNEHMEMPHKIKCSHCAMIFVESDQLYRHQSSAHTEIVLKKFQCAKCSKKFLTEMYLKRHIYKVHEQKMSDCPICSEQVTRNNWSRHLEIHKTKGVRATRKFCMICQVYLQNKEKFQIHLKTKLHLDKVSEKNEGGSEEFILPDDNIKSAKSAEQKNFDEGIFDPTTSTKVSRSLSYKCHECGLKFRNFFYKEAHRVKYHGGDQKINFHCKLCDINFSRKMCLKTHLENSMMHKIKEKEAKNNK